MQNDNGGDRPASAMDRRGFINTGAGAVVGAMIAGAAASATAAPQAGANRPVSIDLHTHWTPPAYNKAVAKLAHGGGGGNPDSLSTNLDRRLQWMDTHGVQMHVLTLSGGMPWQWVPPDVGATLAQIINDANVEAHLAHPDRFMGGIELSIRDPKLSLKELDRMAGKPGMRAVHLPNSFETRDYLFEPQYEPLLARCEELGYPLLFHPLDGEINYYSNERLGADKESDEAFLYNVLGFPFTHATTAAKFIINGTLDKYPKLEIVLPHSGGVFPYIAARMAHDYDKPVEIKLKHPFRDYLRRFHYDTLTYFPETLRFLITQVGSDRVVIGTDNYAIMDVEYPNALVEEINLPAQDRDLIFKGNASRLLHL
jgi:aminocarboxymuconate-semialdehyde decarboxylase